MPLYEPRDVSIDELRTKQSWKSRNVSNKVNGYPHITWKDYIDELDAIDLLLSQRRDDT